MEQLSKSNRCLGGRWIDLPVEFRILCLLRKILTPQANSVCDPMESRWQAIGVNGQVWKTGSSVNFRYKKITTVGNGGFLSGTISFGSSAEFSSGQQSLSFRRTRAAAHLDYPAEASRILSIRYSLDFPPDHRRTKPRSKSSLACRLHSHWLRKSRLLRHPFSSEVDTNPERTELIEHAVDRRGEDGYNGPDHTRTKLRRDIVG